MNKYAGINIKYHQMSKLFQIRVSKFYDFIYHLQTSSGKRPQRDLETMLKWCDHFGLVWLTNEKLTGWLVWSPGQQWSCHHHHMHLSLKQALLHLDPVVVAHRCTIFLCIWDGKYSTGWWPPIGGGGRSEMRLQRPKYTKLDLVFCKMSMP